MRILLHYLKPYKWLVAFSLLLAAINQSFSLMDPFLMGKLLDLFATHPFSFDKPEPGHAALFPRTVHQFIWGGDAGGIHYYGVIIYLCFLIGVAMVSRIAKAFQDYYSSVVIQKFGASIFTEGLQHSLKLPYADFEDQRSGETLSILTKVREDTSKFITNFINIVFGVLVGLVFVTVYAFFLDWRIVAVYLAGAVLLSWLTSMLSRRIKVIQKNIVKETTSLAGTTT